MTETEKDIKETVEVMKTLDRDAILLLQSNAKVLQTYNEIRESKTTDKQ